MSDIIKVLSFDIIKEEFPELANDLIYANDLIKSDVIKRDPHLFFVQTRIIGETVAKEVFKREGLKFYVYEKEIYKEIEDPTFSQRITAIKNNLDISSKYIEILEKLRDEGNIGAHPHDKDYEKISEMRGILEECYYLCLWFSNEYGTKHCFVSSNKMKEFFIWRGKQKPIKIETIPKKENFYDKKNDSNCSLASSALKMLKNSVLGAISFEEKSFDNYIDESFFDKHSFLKTFRDIPEKNIRISRDEVSQWLYAFIMKKNQSFNEGINNPVENVSFVDAVKFCNELSNFMGIPPAYSITGSRVSLEKDSLGFRLPTIYEWQDAAKKRLYDNCGNVWEWCEDQNRKDIYRATCFARKSVKDYFVIVNPQYYRIDTQKNIIGFRIAQNIK